MKIKSLIMLFIVALFAISACKQKPKQDNSEKLSGSITIDGSSTVYPITEAIAEEFMKLHPDVKITIGISGTGGGFKKFGRGELDIADASRPIKDKEKDVCKEKNIEFIELMVAYDGLAVLVNPENNWLDSITVAELKKIWEPEAQGKIKKWNQVRKEWPNEEIHLFGPGVASGTYDYFTEAIVGESGKSRGDFTASEDDNILVQGVAGDKYGLGFFGLAYYEENADKLKIVAVDNGKGAIKPTMESITNGIYTPLSRPLFIYITKNALARPEVKAFVEFYLKNVSGLVKDVGYIPLHAEETQKQDTVYQDFIKNLK